MHRIAQRRKSCRRTLSFLLRTLYHRLLLSARLRSVSKKRSTLTKTEMFCFWFPECILGISSLWSRRKVDQSPSRAAIGWMNLIWHKRLRSLGDAWRDVALFLDAASVCFRAVAQKCEHAESCLLATSYLNVKARIELGSSSRTRIGLSAKICSVAALVSSNHQPLAIKSNICF